MKISFATPVAPPTKLPFVVWSAQDSNYRIVCTAVAKGTADFALEVADGTDAMGQQRWVMITVGQKENPIITAMTYDFLDAICPAWRSLGA